MTCSPIWSRLSRTRRKDYENYVVNRIWTRLDGTEIKPVTQQYCRRSNGNYALLDRDFPQLGIAVECDETFHDSSESVIRDHERTAEIRAISEQHRLGAVLDHGIDIKRVVVSEGLSDTNTEIEKIVTHPRSEKRQQIRGER